MDIYIWYTLLSAIIGGVMGARARLGEVELVHYLFLTYCDMALFFILIISFRPI